MCVPDARQPAAHEGEERPAVVLPGLRAERRPHRGRPAARRRDMRRHLVLRVGAPPAREGRRDEQTVHDGAERRVRQRREYLLGAPGQNLRWRNLRAERTEELAARAARTGEAVPPVLREPAVCGPQLGVERPRRPQGDGPSADEANRRALLPPPRARALGPGRVRERPGVLHLGGVGRDRTNKQQGELLGICFWREAPESADEAEGEDSNDAYAKVDKIRELEGKSFEKMYF